jgi:hypothetical protein
MTSAAVASLVVLLLAGETAAADPAPRHVETEEVRLLCVPPAPPTRCIELPPGHFVDAATWRRLDLAIREAQDDRTRLTARDLSLRSSARAGSPAGRIALAALGGLVGGWYLHDVLH